MATLKFKPVEVSDHLQEADRVNPGVLHQDVQDKRDAVSKRLAFVNAKRMHNADRRQAIIAELAALDASDKALDSEREELIAIDDALSEETRKLECILVRRSGQ